MTLRVVGVCGNSGAGKTTLVRRLLVELADDWAYEHQALVKFYRSRSCRTIVLGEYAPGEPFAGVDRMSHAARPSVLWMLRYWAAAAHYAGWVVCFEGAKLMFPSFVLPLCAEPAVDLRLLLLTAPEGALESRRGGRGDRPHMRLSQRSAYTRLKNLLRDVPAGRVTELGPGAEDALPALRELLGR